MTLDPIAAYERTLVADQTPWDRFTAGDPTALTAQQRQDQRQRRGLLGQQEPGQRCARQRPRHAAPLDCSSTADRAARD